MEESGAERLGREQSETNQKIEMILAQIGEQPEITTETILAQI